MHGKITFFLALCWLSLLSTQAQITPATNANSASQLLAVADSTEAVGTTQAWWTHVESLKQKGVTGTSGSLTHYSQLASGPFAGAQPSHARPSVTISQGKHTFYDLDLRNLTVVIQGGADVTFYNCRFGQEPGVKVWIAPLMAQGENTKLTLRFCDFVGPGDGSGAGMMLRGPVGDDGRAAFIDAAYCRTWGQAFDSWKIARGTSRFCYFDPSVATKKMPETWDENKTYQPGDYLTEGDIYTSHVWRAKQRTTQKPRFDLKGKKGQNYNQNSNNQWTYSNPHADIFHIYGGRYRVQAEGLFLNSNVNQVAEPVTGVAMIGLNNTIRRDNGDETYDPQGGGTIRGSLILRDERSAFAVHNNLRASQDSEFLRLEHLRIGGLAKKSIYPNTTVALDSLQNLDGNPLQLPPHQQETIDISDAYFARGNSRSEAPTLAVADKWRVKPTKYAPTHDKQGNPVNAVVYFANGKRVAYVTEDQVVFDARGYSMTLLPNGEYELSAQDGTSFRLVVWRGESDLHTGSGDVLDETETILPISSTPQDGATLAEPPTVLKLTYGFSLRFSEVARPTVMLCNRSGEVVTQWQPTVSKEGTGPGEAHESGGSAFFYPSAPLNPGERYTLSWDAHYAERSSDNQPVGAGSLTFSVEAPTPTTDSNPSYRYADLPGTDGPNAGRAAATDELIALHKNADDYGGYTGETDDTGWAVVTVSSMAALETEVNARRNQLSAKHIYELDWDGISNKDITLQGPDESKLSARAASLGGYAMPSAQTWVRPAAERSPVLGGSVKIEGMARVFWEGVTSSRILTGEESPNEKAAFYTGPGYQKPLLPVVAFRDCKIGAHVGGRSGVSSDDYCGGIKGVGGQGGLALHVENCLLDGGYKWIHGPWKWLRVWRTNSRRYIDDVVAHFGFTGGVWTDQIAYAWIEGVVARETVNAVGRHSDFFQNALTDKQNEKYAGARNLIRRNVYYAKTTAYDGQSQGIFNTGNTRSNDNQWIVHDNLLAISAYHAASIAQRKSNWNSYFENNTFVRTAEFRLSRKNKSESYPWLDLRGELGGSGSGIIHVEGNLFAQIRYPKPNRTDLDVGPNFFVSPRRGVPSGRDGATENSVMSSAEAFQGTFTNSYEPPNGTGSKDYLTYDDRGFAGERYEDVLTAITSHFKPKEALGGWARGGITDPAAWPMRNANADASESGATPASRLQITEFSRDKAPFDSGAGTGRNNADIPFVVKARDAQDNPVANVVIEGRFVPQGGGQATAWKVVGTTDAQGTVRGAIGMTRHPDYLQREVRIKNNPEVTAITKNSFGVGHTIVVLAQSNLDQGFKKTHGKIPKPKSLSVDMVQHYYHERDNGNEVANPRVGSQYIRRWDTGVSDSEDVTGWPTAFANALTESRPGEKFFVVWHVQEGTGYTDMVGNGGKRIPRVEAALADYVYADGQARGGIVGGAWTHTPGSTGTEFEEVHFPIFFAKSAKGDPVTVPSVVQYGNQKPYNLDHWIGDWYDLDEITYALQDPHQFGPRGSTLKSATLNVDGTLNYWFTKREDIRQSIREMVRNPNATNSLGEKIMLPIYMGALNYAIGEINKSGTGYGDGTHPSDDTPDGGMLLNALLAHGFLRAADLTDWPEPVFDRHYRHPSGAWWEWWSTAGPITTTRRVREEKRPTPPAGYNASHWTEVVAFQIDKKPAKRVEIVNGRVRIYPPTGETFAPDDLSRISHGDGGASGHLNDGPDRIAELWKDIAIIDFDLPGIDGVALRAQIPPTKAGNATNNEYVDDTPATDPSPDTTRPYVETVVATPTKITATYSEPVRQRGFGRVLIKTVPKNQTAVDIKVTQEGTTPGTIEYDGAKVMVRPASPLPAGEYAWRPQKNIFEDLAGNFAEDVINNYYHPFTIGASARTVTDRDKIIMEEEMLSSRVYPNPNHGQFTVHIPEAEDNRVTISILSLSGQVLSEVQTQGARHIPVQTSLPAGTYIVKIVSPEASYVERLIVE